MKRRKTLTIHEYELPIVLQEQEEGGFVAQCSIWDDCYAQGDTIEEAINESAFVASSLIELYREEGLNIPLKLKKSTKRPATNLTITLPLIVSA